MSCRFLASHKLLARADILAEIQRHILSKGRSKPRKVFEDGFSDETS